MANLRPLDVFGLAAMRSFWQNRAMRHLIAALFLTSPALAETPMTGAEFETFVTGKTLTFAIGSEPYGVEYYAPDRRVIWSFSEGECVNGTWYDVATNTGTNICFVYENDPDPQCWQVFDVGGKLRADFMNRPGTTVLYEAYEADPLVCGGVGT
jgi:hypothetical protein